MNIAAKIASVFINTKRSPEEGMSGFGVVGEGG
jgi:hypothetical protein